VKKRNNDILEEKKSKALWRLEKIDLRASASGTIPKDRGSNARSQLSLDAERGHR
jgi:hypothetical protein